MPRTGSAQQAAMLPSGSGAVISTRESTFRPLPSARLTSRSITCALPRRTEEPMTSKVRFVLTAVLTLSVAAGNGSGQSFQGGLRGTVKDAQGVIPGVTITLTAEET